MGTNETERRRNRLTVECPIVKDVAVETAARNMWSHEARDYVSQNIEAAGLRTTRELPAVDASLCA